MGLGILLDDTDGAHSLSGSVWSTPIDPPGGDGVENFDVELDTASEIIIVTAFNNFGVDYARHTWDYDAGGVIEDSPTITTASFGAPSGNTTDSPLVDLNDDGTNEEIDIFLGFAGQFLVTTTVQNEVQITIGTIRSIAQS
jgi:hypothetical protein